MACVHCLRDGSASVCETACRVVGAVAARGDSRAVAVLARSAPPRRPPARAGAARGAERGAGQAVSPLLGSPMGYVRLAALAALEKIGAVGDAKLLQAVMQVCATTPRRRRRRARPRGLTRRDAARAGGQRLSDKEMFVKREAVVGRPARPPPPCGCARGAPGG
jgi:hypothetical protein